MKAIEQYFPVVLFIMLYKVVLTFEAVDEIQKSGHSNGSYSTVHSSGAVYYPYVQGGSNFWVCGWNPKVWLYWAALSCSAMCFSMHGKMIFFLVFLLMLIMGDLGKGLPWSKQ